MARFAQARSLTHARSNAGAALVYGGRSHFADFGCPAGSGYRPGRPGSFVSFFWKGIELRLFGLWFFVGFYIWF